MYRGLGVASLLDWLDCSVLSLFSALFLLDLLRLFDMILYPLLFEIFPETINWNHIGYPFQQEDVCGCQFR